MGAMRGAMRAAMRRAMKAKKSVIAKGKLAKLVVFRGTKAKTTSGLKKTDLMRKKAYSFIKGWTAAVTKARKALGVKGFVAVKRGTPCTRRRRSSTGTERPLCAPADMALLLDVGLSHGLSERLAQCVSLPSNRGVETYTSCMH